MALQAAAHGARGFAEEAGRELVVSPHSGSTPGEHLAWSSRAPHSSGGGSAAFGLLLCRVPNVVKENQKPKEELRKERADRLQDVHNLQNKITREKDKNEELRRQVVRKPIGPTAAHVWKHMVSCN
ncbi:hypothetical protein GUJ93_ZPchr0011g27933 [Zizania palustris]|uniref:Uncharacterized protein n=1 Tax=Zizania palustris TaxID=103762 RepID=A0A8J6BL61_ZIZPA|nr:hypothetical protein GUJ93_ZPchr0011g27933 [Zizania palustris]